MPKPIKILHVLSSFDKRDGGPIRAVVDLSAEGEAYNLESHLLAPGPLTLDDNPVPEERLHVAPPAIFRSFRYAPGLRRWLRAHVGEFDGVVIHGVWLYPGYAAAMECLRAGVPYACFPHGMIDLYPVNRSGFFKRLKKHLYWYLVENWLYEGAVAVVFTTQRELRNASATFQINNRKLVVVPYGIAPVKRRTSRPGNQDLWQPPERRVALFLGRVHPKKNVGFLIEAWNRASVAPDYHLVIAGPGDPEYLAGLAKLAAAGPYRDRIHFVGWVSGDDKAYLLERAEWFLLPSLQENFGVAVLEASQAGCAVAISNEVYLADYLSPESAVMDLRLATWTEFFSRRMADEARRVVTAAADRVSLNSQLNAEDVNRNWAEAFRQLFTAPHD
jgi:glycosyltransferase involved in cell wall biosynthesis